jgi:DNA-binding transcriptional MocR family regulator
MERRVTGKVGSMPEFLGLPHDALALTSDAPVSLQLAVAMRWAIIQQQVPEGTQLPSEPVLAEWFGISRDTVSRAFGILRHAGIVATKRGKGHYVIHVPPFEHILLPAGTTVTVRRPTSAMDRAYIESGSQLYSPVVEIRRPGEPPEIRDSACVFLEFRNDESAEP